MTVKEADRFRLLKDHAEKKITLQEVTKLFNRHLKLSSCI